MNARAAMETLHRTLVETISDAVAVFERETDLSPTDIDVVLVEVTQIGGPRRHVVGSVRIRIEGP